MRTQVAQRELILKDRHAIIISCLASFRSKRSSLQCILTKQKVLLRATKIHRNRFSRWPMNGSRDKLASHSQTFNLHSHIPDKFTFFQSRYRGEHLLRKGRPSPSRAGKQTSSFLCQLCWQFNSNTRHFATFAAKVAARINYLDNSSPVRGWFPALHFPTSSLCLCIPFHSSSLFSPPPSSPPPLWGKSARWGAPHRKKLPPGDI